MAKMALRSDSRHVTTREEMDARMDGMKAKDDDEAENKTEHNLAPQPAGRDAKKVALPSWIVFGRVWADGALPIPFSVIRPF